MLEHLAHEEGISAGVAEHRLYPLAVRLYAEGRLRVVGNKVTATGSVPPDIAALNPSGTLT